MTEQTDSAVRVSGVYVQKNGSYRAYLKRDGVQRSIGMFDTYEAAAAARLAAEDASGYRLDHAARLAEETGVEWRPMVGFHGYFVSADGRVYSAPRSWANGRFLSQLVKAGYLTVCPCKGNRPTTTNVHRAVLMAFDREPVGLEQAAHLNGIRTDNRIGNLKWCTAQENALHKNAHGTMLRGERSPAAKLSDAEVALVRKRFARGEKQSALAREYGVSPSCVGSIVKMRSRILPTESHHA